MPNVSTIRQAPMASNLEGTRLFERPVFKPKARQRKFSFPRFRKAAEAFHASLKGDQMAGRPMGLVDTNENSMKTPSPVGFLVGGGKELPLYAGQTRVVRSGSLLRTQFGATMGEGEPVCVLETNLSNGSLTPLGRTDPYHHGATLTFGEESYRVVLFSSDLWPREVSHD